MPSLNRKRGESPSLVLIPEIDLKDLSQDELYSLVNEGKMWICPSSSSTARCYLRLVGGGAGCSKAPNEELTNQSGNNNSNFDKVSELPSPSSAAAGGEKRTARNPSSVAEIFQNTNSFEQSSSAVTPAAETLADLKANPPQHDPIAPVPRTLLSSEKISLNRATSLLECMLFVNNEIAKKMIDYQHPTIRIFLSSTSSDTGADKEDLMTRVYPKLHEKCAASGTGLTFEAVDMKWGIMNDEVGKDHRTWEMSRKEMDLCAKRSMGKYFYCLYADKYGFRPLPRLIPFGVWNKLLNFIESEEVIELLEKWYSQDNNFPVKGMPGVSSTTSDNDEGLIGHQMVLQPIQDAEREQEFMQQVQFVRATLNVAAMRAGISFEDRMPFSASETEHEIRHCIQRRLDGDRAVWVRRRISNSDSVKDKKLRAMFVAQPEEFSLLHRLETAVKEKFKERVEVEVTIEELLQHHEGVQTKVCSAFEKLLSEEIDSALSLLSGLPWSGEKMAAALKAANAAAIAAVEGEATPTTRRRLITTRTASEGREFVMEMVHHVRMIADRSAEFVSLATRNSELLAQVKTFISTATPSKVFFLQGPSGAGKAPLIARALDHHIVGVPAVDDPTTIVTPGKATDLSFSDIIITRFLGTSLTSTDPCSMLASVHRQLLWALEAEGIVLDNNDATADGTAGADRRGADVAVTSRLCRAMRWHNSHILSQMVEELCSTLRAVSPSEDGGNDKNRRRVFLILDSLDQLSDRQQGRSQVGQWIKKLSDAGAIIIISALTDEPGKYDYGIAESLKKAEVPLAETAVISLSPLKPSDITAMVDRFLLKHFRTLCKGQRDFVEARLAEQSQGMLYFHLLMEEVCRWPSLSPTKPAPLPPVPEKVRELIQNRFQDLEKLYHIKVIRRALSSIAAARSGLSSRELCEILTCDERLMRDGGPVFQHMVSVTKLRCFPPGLWYRLTHDLGSFFTSLEEGGYFRFHHRQYQEAAVAKYMATQKKRLARHKALANYFSGKSAVDVAQKDKTVALCINPQKWFERDTAVVPVGTDENHSSSNDDGAAAAAAAAQPVVVNERKALELFYHAWESGAIDTEFAHFLLTIDYVECRARCRDTFAMVSDFEKWVEKVSSSDQPLPHKQRVINIHHFLKTNAAEIHSSPWRIREMASVSKANMDGEMFIMT